jgi:proline iminopeptidase
MTPDQYTIQEFWLDVGDGHKLYVQDWGNQKAKKTIVFLHGGPGSGCSNKFRRVFDPKTQRVVFFDQRGSGRSTPYGSLVKNTTSDLINDISKITKHLKLDQFILYGQSWGSSLALFYTISNPKKVSHLVIGAVLAGTEPELSWVDKGGFRQFYPDVWDRVLESTPVHHHDDPVGYHFSNILGKDKQKAKKSAYVYENLERGILQLDDYFLPDSYEEYDPSAITIEVHYLQHKLFMPNRFVFDNVTKITMPVYIIQGRYDIVCPPNTAYQLHKLIENSQLHWTISGHKSEHEDASIYRSIFRSIASQ